jgi:hypothetical protein
VSHRGIPAQAQLGLTASAAAKGYLRIGAADIRQAQLPETVEAGNVILRRPSTSR